MEKGGFIGIIRDYRVLTEGTWGLGGPGIAPKLVGADFWGLGGPGIDPKLVDGCGEVMGKGKILKGCICDTDPQICPGVKGKGMKNSHRKHYIIPVDLKTNLVLDIDLKSFAGQIVSSDEGVRNEQGKEVQIRMLAHLDTKLKMFCRNGGNKEFRMVKMNLDYMGFAVHTSHGIKYQGTKKPVAVLSYHIVVNALCMLWETPSGDPIQKKFWKSIGINSKKLEGFDEGIYTPGRPWRTINNTKPDAKDRRTFVPSTLTHHNEIACHIAQAIHPSAVEITMMPVASHTPKKSLARDAVASSRTCSVPTPGPESSDDEEGTVVPLPAPATGGSTLVQQYDTDSEDDAESGGEDEINMAKVDFRSTLSGKALAAYEEHCGWVKQMLRLIDPVDENKWFRVCNYLSCSGLPKGVSGAHQHWEVFDEWSQGLYHETKVKSEIAQKNLYSQEKCVEKWMYCINTYRLVGTVYGLGYLREEVDKEDKARFSAIVRRLNTSHLSDPHLDDIHLRTLARMTLLARPGTIIVSEGRKNEWFLPDQNNMFCFYDAGRSMMDRYISGECVEVINEARTDVMEKWAPYGTTENPCGVYTASSVLKIADANLTVCNPSYGCGLLRITDPGPGYCMCNKLSGDDQKAALPGCGTCVACVGIDGVDGPSIACAFAEASAPVTAPVYKELARCCAKKTFRIKTLRGFISKCNDEPSKIIGLIEHDAKETTKNVSEFMKKVDIGMTSERHPRGSLMTKFIFQDKVFDLDVKYFRHEVQKSGQSDKDFYDNLDRRMLKYYIGNVRLIDCAVRSCNYDIPVDWTRKTPKWNVPEEDIDVIYAMLGSCFHEVHPESGDTRKEMVTYLLRIIASAMSSGNPEHSMFYFIGGGANGKGMISNLIQTVFGQEAGRSGFFSTTKAETFSKRRGTGEHTLSGLVAS